MKLNFSFIIPVYNRPAEIKELLQSMKQQQYDEDFEIVVVEDGSTHTSEEVIASFKNDLHISYFKKPNTGPGHSRNYGMKRAKGNYFLILDSDVILPPRYLAEVEKGLSERFVDCFGGPDAAMEGFTNIQKAINYSMTSLLTTGGIRGGKKMVGKFEPRSFNMGLSKAAFEKSEGFGNIHPGEDPDLALRLRKFGFETVLFPEAYVYHKRRIDWKKFYNQVYKFGLVRPILNMWHPASKKITFWFPSLFSLGFLAGIFLLFFGIELLFYLYLTYFLILFLHATAKNGSIKIGLLSVWATIVQFYGYGLGFCRATCYIRFFKNDPQKRFPKLFFKNAQPY